MLFGTTWVYMSTLILAWVGARVCHLGSVIVSSSCIGLRTAAPVSAEGVGPGLEPPLGEAQPLTALICWLCDQNFRMWLLRNGRPRVLVGKLPTELASWLSPSDWLRLALQWVPWP